MQLQLNRETIPGYLVKLIFFVTLFILFLPLTMHSAFFFPFIVVKNLLFRIAVEVIFAAYLILAYLEPRYRPKFNAITIAVLTFFAVSVVAGLLGIGRYESVWGNYERMGGLFHQLHLVLFVIVLANTIKAKEHWHSFFTFSIFASSIMSLLAFAQWLEVPFLLQSSGGSRLTGSLGNATFFAAYLLFNLFFILYFWIKEQRFDLKLFALSYLVFDGLLVLTAILSGVFGDADWGMLGWLKTPLFRETWQFPQLIWPFIIFQALIFSVWFFRSQRYVVRGLLTILFLFDFFIFFNTQTRGALIGFFVSLVFLALVGAIARSVPVKIRQLSIGFLLLLVIVPVGLVLAKDSKVVQSNETLGRLANISLADTTTASRLYTWRASWLGWTESPKSFLIGYGPENYYYAFNKHFPPEIFRDAGSQIWFDRAHNIIFDIGVTTGLIGLLAYLGILGLVAWSFVKRYKATGAVSQSYLFIGLIIAYFIQNIFVFDTLNSEILLYLVIGFAIFQLTEQKSTDQSVPAQSFNFVYIGGVLIAMVMVIFFVNVRTLQANHFIYKALITATDIDQAVTYFEQAIDMAVVGHYEARQQLANYALELRGKTGVTKERLSDIFDRATTQLEQSVADEPLNVRHYVWLAGFHNGAAVIDLTRPDQAIAVAQKAIELSPDRPQTYFEIGQAYLLKEDYENATKYFQIGVDKAPWVGDSQWTLLALGIGTGNKELVDQQLAVIEAMTWKPRVANYQQGIALANRTKNNTLAIQFYLGLISLEPDKAEHYAQLAAIYAKTGENEKAHEMTEKAVELDPSLEPESKTFLELLDRGDLRE